MCTQQFLKQFYSWINHFCVSIVQSCKLSDNFRTIGITPLGESRKKTTGKCSFMKSFHFDWQSLVSVDKLDHVILTARKPLYHSSIHVVCIYWPKSFPHQDSEDHYVVGRFINNKGWNYKKKCNEQMYWINCYKLANKKCNIDFSNFDSFIDMFVYLQNGNIHAF